MQQYDEQYQPKISRMLSVPKDERARLIAMAELAAPEHREAMDKALRDYAQLRNMKRREQQRRGERDRYKRTMLAIHVPFDYALAVTAKAEAEGMSVYKWLRRVVDEAMR